MSLVYTQNPRVATRNFRGEAAFITPEDRRINILNRTATEIWELCATGPMTLDALCDEMVSRYAGAPSAIRRDVQELLEGLVEMGALMCREDVRGGEDEAGGAGDEARAQARPKPESEG